MNSRVLSVTLLLASSMRVDAATTEVVVYTSVDDVFARPVAEAFTRQTKVAVKLVTDTEETKSTGLLNRLIAEKNRPQADVFWSGDPVRAEILKSKGIAAQYRSPNAASLAQGYSDAADYWTGFSARERVILYNTKLLTKAQAPQSILDLANSSALRNKSCVANPLFGTTSMQAAALFVVLGEQRARAHFEALIANGTRMLSSNGEVRRRVAEGDCAVGVVDSDDAYAAVKDQKPVAVVYPDEKGMGTILIPNAAVLIVGAPNSAGGRQFIDFLISEETEKMLAASDAAQTPLRAGVQVPAHVRALEQLHPMPLDYSKLATTLDELARGYLKEWAARASR